MEFLEWADSVVWGPFLLASLLGTGIFLMIRLQFLPLRRLKYAIFCAVGLDRAHRRDQRSGKQKNGVSPFAALMNELATTIGTGNIVGVATAMALGGPGALFWMMISALIGMATKLTESMLSVKYRTIYPDGVRVGGPMYTMKAAVKPEWFGKILAFLFSFFALCAAFGMGNMTQANSISAAFEASFGIPVYKTGLLITILTILVVLGGIRGLSHLTMIMVPFMGIFYIAACLGIIYINRINLWDGVIRMIGMAFCPEAFQGGVIGGITVTFANSFRWGIARGVFSNEAGIGAAGISAACADTKDPVRQGYISMTGVFFDTVVICFLTGLAIASSGLLESVDQSGNLLTGMALVTAVFNGALGKWGGRLLAVSVGLFAFATIAGWAYQGEKVFEFLTGSRRHNYWFHFFYSLSAFVGSVASLDLVWTFSDICNGLMAYPNLICVLLLSGEAVREIREYDKKQGIAFRGRP